MSPRLAITWLEVNNWISVVSRLDLRETNTVPRNSTCRVNSYVAYVVLRTNVADVAKHKGNIVVSNEFHRRYANEGLVSIATNPGG